MEPTKLEQRKFLQKRVYEILSSDEIRVNLKSLFKTQGWKMSLEEFDPEPMRFKTTHLTPLVVVIPLASLALTLLVTGLVAAVTGKFFGGLLVIGSILGLMAFAFFLKVLSGSANVLSFSSAGGSQISFGLKTRAKSRLIALS